MHFDLQHLVQSLGYVGVWAIIFAESGLLIGFFLPGDSLLFTAGFVASQNLLNLWVFIAGAIICAALGDNVGYATGYRFGRRLFQRQDSWFFHKKHLVKTERFYAAHGRKTLILARFLPIIRTFAPIVAGLGSMHYRTFTIYNLVGGFLWAGGVTLLGYGLGRVLPPEQVDRYLLPIVLVIIVVSVLPSLWHVWKEHRNAH